MFKKLDERTIIVESTPMLPTFPDQPEPVRVEVRKLTKAELLKEKFPWWTDEQFQEAQGLNFPIAGKRPRFLNWGIDLVWREDQIDRWVVEQRERAENVLRLVGK